MVFNDFYTEREIRRTLRAISKQRVALVLQPGDLWVIERAVEDTAKTDAALKTCQIRGWIEPLTSAVPKGRLTRDGNLPSGPLFDRVEPLYRLTEGGWAVVNRSNQIALFAFLISILSLCVSIAVPLHIVFR